MGDLDQLLVVQEHDTQADQLRHRREHMPERGELADREADRRGLLERLAEVGERRDELARSQKRLEDELAMVEAKAAEVDRKLYSGSVTNPRELQAMQDEISSLKRRQSMLEDQDLEIMEAAEPVDAELSALEAEHARLESEIERLLGAIAQSESEIDAGLAAADEGRRKAAAGLPDELLAHYDDLRRRLTGVVAARLTGSSCGGCHLTLPATEIDRIKRQPSDALVHCEECGRILVRS